MAPWYNFIQIYFFDGTKNKEKEKFLVIVGSDLLQTFFVNRVSLFQALSTGDNFNKNLPFLVLHC